MCQHYMAAVLYDHDEARLGGTAILAKGHCEKIAFPPQLPLPCSLFTAVSWRRSPRFLASLSLCPSDTLPPAYPHSLLLPLQCPGERLLALQPSPVIPFAHLICFRPLAPIRPSALPPLPHSSLSAAVPCRIFRLSISSLCPFDLPPPRRFLAPALRLHTPHSPLLRSALEEGSSFFTLRMMWFAVVASAIALYVAEILTYARQEGGEGGGRGGFDEGG